MNEAAAMDERTIEIEIEKKIMILLLEKICRQCIAM